jgi:hypothetical protein
MSAPLALPPFFLAASQFEVIGLDASFVHLSSASIQSINQSNDLFFVTVCCLKSIWLQELSSNACSLIQSERYLPFLFLHSDCQVVRQSK